MIYLRIYMSEIIIEPIKPEDIPEASKVISRAFAPTPVVVAVAKGSGEKQQRKLESGMKYMFKKVPGHMYVAKNNGEIVGAMRMVKWPECQPTPLQGLRMLPFILIKFGTLTPRVMKFRSIWGKNDPKKPHWHLDPLTVKPGMQGQGIGTKLLTHFCKIVDESGLPAYLETDQTRNIRLYERFGFTVTGEVPVFGVSTWFMWRPEQHKD
jgi:ribosomal protein S18 acetylase RimI-like enzyme